MNRALWGKFSCVFLIAAQQLNDHVNLSSSQVLHIVAGIRGVDANELAEQVWENTCDVFFP
jgi:Tat protein secretion system quality control protein TatD with DNase activity